MSKISTYKDLIVWQKSIELVKRIYLFTKNMPSDERFGLVSQMTRCVVSIPSNIAEGWERNSTKSYLQFLRISRGSLFELETLLIIAKELGYVQDSSVEENLILEIGKMLNTIISKLEKQNKIV